MTAHDSGKIYWLPILAAVFVLAAWFRFSGLNWDQGSHLHPDERFMTMTAEALKPVDSLAEYFDTSLSGLNPHNVGKDFYVYGTLPLHLTRFIANLFNMADYSGICRVGRFLSAVFDMLTLLAVFLIGSNLFCPWAGTAAAAFYATSVLAIQNAHFFTVDSPATAFICWALYFSVRAAGRPDASTGSLVAFAMCAAAAAASKIYLLAGLAVIPMIFFLKARQKPCKNLFSRAVYIGVSSMLLLVLTAVFFRLFYPYLFRGQEFLDLELNQKVIDNFRQLSQWVKAGALFPPSLQWIGRDFFFSPINLAVWGMGLPFFCLALTGLLLLTVAAVKNAGPAMIITFWSTGWFLLQSAGPNPTLRYQFPALPGFAIAAAWLWAGKERCRLTRLLGALVFVATLFQAIAFSAIYERPHPRVAASKWILENIASGTVLAFESAWDDAIPLYSCGDSARVKNFLDGQNLQLHEPDSAAKIDQMLTALEKSEIVVVTSNRMYGSLCRLPELFPATIAYYRELLGIGPQQNPIEKFAALADICKTSEQPIINSKQTPPTGGFEPIAVFSSFPAIGPMIINDQSAEEAFTVYDHPQVTLFRKTAAFNSAALKEKMLKALSSAPAPGDRR